MTARVNGHLPGWALLEVTGPGLRRIFGHVSEAEVAGERFLDVQYPVGRTRQLVNARVVRAITPLSEAIAAKWAGQQWRDLEDAS